MRIALTGIIIESLHAGKHASPPRTFTLEELQKEVTRRNIREGLTPSLLRRFMHSPYAIWRLFRRVPKERIVKRLLIHRHHKRVQVSEWSEQFIEDYGDDLTRLTRIFSLHGTLFSLTDGAGEESYERWQKTRARHAQK